MKRVGIDIGGTFTDLVVYDEETKQLTKSKVLTTIKAPEEGFLQACKNQELDWTDVSHFLHATTLVTNLLIQRGGADVGLITTKGFRHVIEVGDGRRAETYSLQWERPKPFAPTHLVFEVDERVNASGEIVKALNGSELVRGCREALDCWCQIGCRIAFALLRERRARKAGCLRYSTAGSAYSCFYIVRGRSADPRVSKDEYDGPQCLRDAPRVRLRGASRHGDRRSARSQLHAFRWRHRPVDCRAQSPVILVESGPAAGVLASVFLGRELGIPNIITADMGGTSFDVCVIRKGVPEIHDTMEVEPTVPLRTDCIDVVSVGSGGGSIVWIDEGEALRVGPQSSATKIGARLLRSRRYGPHRDGRKPDTWSS